MTPRHAAARTRFLAAAGIVALHVATLLVIVHDDRRATGVQEAAVYARLLFPPPAKPVPPAPAIAAQARRPAGPKRPVATTAARIAPAPSPSSLTSTSPSPEAETSAAQVPADWADALATRGKLDVASLVAAAGANERARRKEPLERLQDSQRIRGSMDDSPAARAIAKTGRHDCTKKYAGGANLDPLKLIPLLYDTVTDTGCKW